MKRILAIVFLFTSMVYSAWAYTNPPAREITVDTTNFTKNLNSTDTTVQKALNTIDQTASGGSNPGGVTGNIQINGGGNQLGAYLGAVCTGQVVSAISASGVLTCVNYLTLSGLSASGPITYNSTTGAIGWTNSNNYIALTNLSGTNPITYNSATGVIGWTNINNYISRASLSATAPITYNNSTGAFGWTNSNNYIPLTALSSTMSGLTYNSGTGVFSLTSGFYFPNTTDQSNWNGKQSPLTFPSSVQNQSGAISLKGDISSPGNTQYYGTNSSGTKGFYSLPTSLTYPGAGIPNSTGSSWGTSYTTSGSGTVVTLANSPVLTTPTLGVATATTINKITLTAPATGATLTIANGKTLTGNSSLTLTGTDGTTMTFPSTSATIARTDAANTFTGHQTIEGVTSTGATGTGNFVFATSPTFTTPILGVASGSSLNLSSLSASQPIFTDGSKNLISGLFSGNSTKVITTTGALTANDCTKTDINGNLVDAGAPCGTSAPGGTTGQIQYNNAGSFTGSANLVYNGTQLGIQKATPAFALDVGNTGRMTNIVDSGLGFNKPIYSNSAALLVSGSFSGNTTIFGTTNGILTSGHCVSIDSSGNLVDAGGACGGSSQWTTSGSNIYNANAGNVGIGTTTPGQVLTVNGNVSTLGATAGLLTLYEPISAGTNFVSLSAPATMSGNYAVTLPNSDGTNGQFLKTNGSGVWSWGTPSGGGGSGTVATGTVSQEAVYTGTTTVGSGIITDNGTDVGINYTNPTWNLTVGGATGTDFRVVDTASLANGGLFQVVNDPGSGIVNGSRLGGFSMNGVYDSSHDISTHTPAAVYGWGSDTWTSSDNGTYITLETTPNGTTSRTPALYITQNQHVDSSGTAPTVSSCGTSPSVQSKSTDNWGAITIGTGASTTSCFLTFAGAFLNAAHCICQDQTNGAVNANIKCQASTTAMTVTTGSTMSSVGAGDVITYFCGGNE